MVTEKDQSHTPNQRLEKNLENYLEKNSGDLSLLNSLPKKWEKHGDLIVLPTNSFEVWGDYSGPELWTVVAKSLGGQRLAIKGEISGPERIPNTSAIELAKQFQRTAITAIIYTDISTDGTLAGPNLAATEAMATATDIPVIASGGIGLLNAR